MIFDHPYNADSGRLSAAAAGLVAVRRFAGFGWCDGVWELSCWRSGGAAEPGVVGVPFDAGHEADVISMLGPLRHECGTECPGLFKRRVAPALRVPGPG